MISAQQLYRPDKAEKKGGGSWESNNPRELFYSLHRDEFPAVTVMHRCVVHFIPIHKQLPKRKQHPGFIVQKVYDTKEMKLWNITDKDNQPQEIDELVHKTMQRMGELPDIKTLVVTKNSHIPDPIDELVQNTIQRLGELPDIKTAVVKKNSHIQDHKK
jgi:phosphoketolase